MTIYFFTAGVFGRQWAGEQTSVTAWQIAGKQAESKRATPNGRSLDEGARRRTGEGGGEGGGHAGRDYQHYFRIRGPK